MKPLRWLISGLLAVLPLAAEVGPESDWQSLRAIKPGARLRILTRDSGPVNARLNSWSPERLEIIEGSVHRSLPMSQVTQVMQGSGMSRWKRTLTGALIGFGIGFPIGASSAGYLTDRNSPGAGLRAGVGTSIGLMGAAIGAPIGALSGKRVTKVVYDAPRQQ